MILAPNQGCRDIEGLYLVNEGKEVLGIDGEILMEYVWNKYGDDVR